MSQESISRARFVISTATHDLWLKFYPQVGVRLEDCFYVNDEGLPVFFTAAVGGQAKDPWRP